MASETSSEYLENLICQRVFRLDEKSKLVTMVLIRLKIGFSVDQDRIIFEFGFNVNSVSHVCVQQLFDRLYLVTACDSPLSTGQIGLVYWRPTVTKTPNSTLLPFTHLERNSYED